MFVTHHCMFHKYKEGSESLNFYLEVQVVPALPSALPLQETQEGHPCLADRLVHLAAQLQKECRSLYFLHHLKCQHSLGSCALEHLL